MSVSNSYASALYETAKDVQLGNENIDLLEKQMEELELLFDRFPDFKTASVSPLTSTREKLALLEDLARQLKFLPLMTQFLALIAKKGRLGLLPEMRDAFRTVRLTHEGGVAGQIIAADPLSESEMNSLTKAFTQKLGKKVTFRVAIDPSLLAGVKVTVSGVTYDGTLRSQIQKLRDQLATGIPGGHG